MDFDDVEIKICLQEITRLDLQLNAIIQDIHQCESILGLEELNKDAREKVLNVKERLEDLEKLANEQDEETAKVGLLKEVDNYRKQLTGTQQSLRKANLACQLAAERRERNELTGGQSKVRNRSQSSKADVAKMSSEVTDSLLSLSRSLSAQVQSGEQTLQTLSTSSQQITETQDEFKSMSGHIKNSRKLLTKYGRREITDKLLIMLALIFFFSTVLYILKKRMFSASVIVDTADDLVNTQMGGDMHTGAPPPHQDL